MGHTCKFDTNANTTLSIKMCHIHGPERDIYVRGSTQTCLDYTQTHELRVRLLSSCRVIHSQFLY
uniref:Uncharacterized protein n=1 Tax=Helianthus annuus TaxID=4232 RepID=A0A251TAJ5_HELAN